MSGLLRMMKRRELAIDAQGLERCAAELPALRLLKGIGSAHVHGDVLAIEYDLQHICLAQIEAWAERNGIPLRSGVVHSLQRAVWKFIERNERENAAHPGSGACCNRPPPGGA